MYLKASSVNVVTFVLVEKHGKKVFSMLTKDDMRFLKEKV
jgi:hypothetical protein